MSVFIKVEKDVIDNAIQRESRHCMIVDAIHKKMPHVKNVQVDVATIRFTNPRVHKRYIYLTPPEAQKQILRFDAGKKIDPFVFSLNDHIIKTTTSRPKRSDTRAKKLPGSKSAQHVQETLTRWLSHYKEGQPVASMAPLVGGDTTQASPPKKKQKKTDRKPNWRLAKTLPASEREFGLRKLVGKKIELNA